MLDDNTQEGPATSRSAPADEQHSPPQQGEPVEQEKPAAHAEPAAHPEPAAGKPPEQEKAAGHGTPAGEPRPAPQPPASTAESGAGGGPATGVPRARTRMVEKAQAWSAVASAVLAVVAIVLASLTFADQSAINDRVRDQDRKAIAARVSVMEGLLPTRAEHEMGGPGVVIRNRAPSPVFKVWLLVRVDGERRPFYLDTLPPCAIVGLPRANFAPGSVPAGGIVDMLWFTDDVGNGWQRRATGELDRFTVPTYQGPGTRLPAVPGLRSSAGIDTSMSTEADRLRRGAVIRDAADCGEAN